MSYKFDDDMDNCYNQVYTDSEDNESDNSDSDEEETPKKTTTKQTKTKQTKTNNSKKSNNKSFKDLSNYERYKKTGQYYEFSIPRKEFRNKTVKDLQKEFKDFNLSDFVLVTNNSGTNKIHALTFNNKRINEYAKYWNNKSQGVYECLSSLYSLRLVFDIDYVYFDDEAPNDVKKDDQILKRENLKYLIPLLKDIQKSLNCDLRIAGYGELTKKEILNGTDKKFANKSSNDDNEEEEQEDNEEEEQEDNEEEEQEDNVYEFIYEQKTGLKKLLSLHVLFDMSLTQKQWNQLFKIDYSAPALTDGEHLFKFDLSIYQKEGTIRLMRVPFGNKSTFNDGINITKDNHVDIPQNELTKWFVQDYTQRKDIEKIDILKRYLINTKETKKEEQERLRKEREERKQKEREARKQAGNKNDNTKINDDDKDIYELEKNAAQIVKVPVGLLYDILKLYPMDHYSTFICVNKEHENGEYWAAFVGFLSACPYFYSEISKMLYDVYNIKYHDHPNSLNDYVENYLEKDKKDENESNAYFYHLIQPFKPKTTKKEYLKNSGFDQKRYDEFKKLVKNDKAENDDIIEFNDLRKERKKLIKEWLETDGKTLNLYNDYILTFNTYRIFETPYKTKSLYNYYYDQDDEYTLKEKRSELENGITMYTENRSFNFRNCPLSQADLSKTKKKYITKTSLTKYKNQLTRHIYVSEKNRKNAKSILKIVRKGFVHKRDYNLFLDFIRFKLFNPQKIYLKNFVLYEGKDSLKTGFLNILSDYISKGTVLPNLLGNEFNGLFKNPITVIEEIPQKLDNCKNIREFLKSITSTTQFTLHEKNKNAMMITNCTNLVICTNYKECGGLFDNQVNGEMFKRFYLIEKRTIERKYLDKFGEYVADRANIKAMVEYIKNLKPLPKEEIFNEETQKDYYKFVKNPNINKRCLDIRTIDNTIRTDSKNRKWATLSNLIKSLKSEGIITSIETERQMLEQNNIIKVYKDRKILIKDLVHYFKCYLEIVTGDSYKDLQEFLKNQYEEDYEVSDDEDEDEEQKDDNKQEEEEEEEEEDEDDKPIKKHIKDISTSSDDEDDKPIKLELLKVFSSSSSDEDEENNK